MAKSKKVNKSKSAQKLKVLHPNSRKALKLPGVAVRQERLTSRKSAKSRRQHTVRDKLSWFRDQVDKDKTVFTNLEIAKLIDDYTHRYDSELEQISLIHGIKGRKTKQHFNRETELKCQIEKERRDFDTCGIEIPDLLNAENLIYLKDWKGELNLLPNFKLRKFKRSELENEG